MKKLIAFILMASVILSACASAPAKALPTAVYPVAGPTENSQAPSLTPSLAPTLTETLAPTDTPTPTETFTPTATDTPTPTPLSPALQTATAYKSTQTEIANNATQTVEAKVATATFLGQYKDIDYRELISYSFNHIGEKVKIYIRVFNIVSSQELQGYFGGTYEAVYIRMAEPFSDIYEGNIITVYGTVSDKNCFQNAMGAQICQPLLIDAFTIRPPKPPAHPAGTTGLCKDGTYTSADAWSATLCKNHGGLIQWWGG